MLKTIEGLQGVTVLGRDAQKKVTGKGGCGVKIDGEWRPVNDYNEDGATIDDARRISARDGVRWCCDRCPWN